MIYWAVMSALCLTSYGMSWYWWRKSKMADDALVNLMVQQFGGKTPPTVVVQHEHGSYIHCPACSHGVNTDGRARICTGLGARLYEGGRVFKKRKGVCTRDMVPHFHWHCSRCEYSWVEASRLVRISQNVQSE